MKKIIAILLLAALATSALACQSKKDGADETSATGDETANETDAETTNPEDNIPGDTVLTTEGYDYDDLTQFLEIPDFSTVKAPLAEVEAHWTETVKDIRFENMAFSDPAATDVTAVYDKVNIHYKGYAADSAVTISEETLARMTNMTYDDDGKLEEGDDLVLGSGSFIRAYQSAEHPEKNNSGFEDQLIGAKAGETRTITVTFPDNYGDEQLNGTVVKFDVTINSFQKGSLPELTDAMVSAYTSETYATIDAYKDYIIGYYKNGTAYRTLTNAIKVKNYPEKEIDNEIALYIADYISSNYENELTEEESKAVFDEQYETAKKSAEETVGDRLILEYLFKKFDISLTQDEYLQMRKADFQNYYLYYLYYYGISEESGLEPFFGKDAMIVQYKYEKLLPMLPDLVVFE